MHSTDEHKNSASRNPTSVWKGATSKGSRNNYEHGQLQLLVFRSRGKIPSTVALHRLYQSLDGTAKPKTTYQHGLCLTIEILWGWIKV